MIFNFYYLDNNFNNKRAIKYNNNLLLLLSIKNIIEKYVSLYNVILCCCLFIKLQWLSITYVFFF